MPSKIEHYTYTVSVGGTIVYIGKGQGKRVTHVFGKSHNQKLNEYWFRHILLGEPRSTVEVVFTTQCEHLALQEEQRLIALHQPQCNIQGTGSTNGSQYQVFVNNPAENTSYFFEEDAYIETEAMLIQVEPEVCTHYTKKPQ